MRERWGGRMNMVLLRCDNQKIITSESEIVDHRQPSEIRVRLTVGDWEWVN